MECKDICLEDETIGVRRINRNIMECKVSTQALREKDSSVLIETLWNVKNDVNFMDS